MRALVAVGCSFVVAAVLAPPAVATFAGRNGDLAITISFEEAGPCNDMGAHFNCGPTFGNIFVARGARGRARRVTACSPQRPCDQWAPAYSPDGRRLAYTAGGVVYVARADASHPRLVAEDSFAAAWSPGGRELALAKADGIYRLRLSDNRLLRVTTGQDGDPDWSSRGRIAFTRGFPTEVQGIYTVDAAGGREQRVTTSYESGPSWSPDGRTLAYDRSNTLMVTRPGGAVHTVPGAHGPSAWSPDGRFLAAPIPHGIGVLRPGGTLVRKVRIPGGPLTGIAWQPRR